MAGTPSSGNVSTKLERIAKLAKQMPGVALTTLAHHIDLEWLHEGRAKHFTRGKCSSLLAPTNAAHLAELAAVGGSRVAPRVRRAGPRARTERVGFREHRSGATRFGSGAPASGAMRRSAAALGTSSKCTGCDPGRLGRALRAWRCRWV
jgi:hypothetical protein